MLLVLLAQRRERSDFNGADQPTYCLQNCENAGIHPTIMATLDSMRLDGDKGVSRVSASLNNGSQSQKREINYAQIDVMACGHRVSSASIN